MFKIDKNGTTYEYNSLAHATRENGATSGMNRKTGLRFLEKAGFDLDSIEETKTTRKGSKRSSSLIERIIKKATTVDKDLIKDLTDQLNDKIANLKTGDDVQKIVELRDAIEKAENPKVTKTAVLELVGNMYDEYMEEQKQKKTNEEK